MTKQEIREHLYRLCNQQDQLNWFKLNKFLDHLLDFIPIREEIFCDLDNELIQDVHITNYSLLNKVFEGIEKSIKKQDYELELLFDIMTKHPEIIEVIVKLDANDLSKNLAELTNFLCDYKDTRIEYFNNKLKNLAYFACEVRYYHHNYIRNKNQIPDYFNYVFGKDCINLKLFIEYYAQLLDTIYDYLISGKRSSFVDFDKVNNNIESSLYYVSAIELFTISENEHVHPCINILEEFGKRINEEYDKYWWLREIHEEKMKKDSINLTSTH